MSVHHYLDLSTEHVPPELINQPGGLNSIDGVIARDQPYGAWVYVPSNIDGWLVDYDDGDESLDRIVTLLRRARELNCDWILLDSDGDVDETLPIYDWSNA